MKDSLFAGWLLQRELSKKWTLGAEVYHSESVAAGSRQTTFVDSGGYYNFRDNLSLLFMIGHTMTGERRTVGYLGLYYTWGKDQGGKSESTSSAVRRVIDGMVGRGSYPARYGAP